MAPSAVPSQEPVPKSSPDRPLLLRLYSCPDLVALVRLFGDRELNTADAEREPRIAETGTPLMDDMRTGVKEQVGWMLGRTDGHCVFFDPANRLCTIYNTRPLECRVFNCDGREGEYFRDPAGFLEQERVREEEAAARIALPQLPVVP
jgi:Fe-S-cluster containining protein